MANTLTQQQVESFLRPYGFTGSATNGAAAAFLASNPTANAAFQPYSASRGAIAPSPAPAPQAQQTSSDGSPMMTATLTQKQVEDYLRPYGFTGSATNGAAANFLNANPGVRAAFNEYSASGGTKTPTTPADASLFDMNAATEVGRFLGLLNDGEVATGGLLSQRLSTASPEVKKVYDSIVNPLMSGQRPNEQTLGAALNFATQQATNKVTQDPSYGSLAKAPYKDFKPFALSDYLDDPGYKFRKEQGEKAINAANSAKGNFYSGGALKEANAFNSDLASQEYGAAYNRYNRDFGIGYDQAAGDQNSLYNRFSGLVNTGANAINTGVNNNMDNANQQGSIITGNSNKQASNTINQGSILSGGLSSILGGSTIGQSTYGRAPKLPWQTAGNVNPFGGFY